MPQQTPPNQTEPLLETKIIQEQKQPKHRQPNVIDFSQMTIVQVLTFFICSGIYILSQRTTYMIDLVTNNLCEEICQGVLQVQEEELPLRIRKDKEEKSVQKQIDLVEHKQRVKKLMSQNRKMREKFNKRSQSFIEHIKSAQQNQKSLIQQEKSRQLQHRRQKITQRLSSKSSLMQKIKQSAIQTTQLLNTIKNKKFLYHQKEQSFINRVVLPKIDEERRILERRKDRMKSIDVRELIQHEKVYQEKRRNHAFNRSLTSRMIRQENLYQPPKYVPKSYKKLETEENIKKEFQVLKAQEIEINKLKQKQFIKTINEVHKLEFQLSRCRSSSVQPIVQQKQKPKTQRAKIKPASKQQTQKIGNQYFRTLVQQMKLVRQKRLARKKQRQLQLMSSHLATPPQQPLFQIHSQTITSIHKIQKTEKIHKIRSKKIQNIFNDQKIYPKMKYDQLKHQVEKLDHILKKQSNNLDDSEDVLQRNQIAGCYLDAIKAKISLLSVVSDSQL